MSQILYEKIKSLYERPGTEGEKVAAFEAMKRIEASWKISPTEYYIYRIYDMPREYFGPYDNYLIAEGKLGRDNMFSRIVSYSATKKVWKEEMQFYKDFFGTIHNFDKNSRYVHDNPRDLKEYKKYFL